MMADMGNFDPLGARVPSFGMAVWLTGGYVIGDLDEDGE